MIQSHQDHEAANLGLEDGMDGLFFAWEYRLHGAHVSAQDHVEVAVVNRTTHDRVRLIVIRDESEVLRLTSGRIQVVRALFSRSDSLS